MTISRRVILAAILLFAVSPTLAAQQGPPGSLSIDASAGLSALVGGHFWRTAVALDATLGVRARETPGGTLLIAVSGGVNAPSSNSIACPAMVGADCVGEHPVFLSLGVLAGWEPSTSGPLSFRLLAGPALYHASVDEYRDGYRHEYVVVIVGAQLRGDLALQATTRFALVLSARGAYLPDLEDERLGLGSLGLGLRFR
jgi:hypothetical protein